MLDKWRGGMRLVFWCVMLVEAGLDSEYGVGGKGDAHKGRDCMVWIFGWLVGACGSVSRRGNGRSGLMCSWLV